MSRARLGWRDQGLQSSGEGVSHSIYSHSHETTESQNPDRPELAILYSTFSLGYMTEKAGPGRIAGIASDLVHSQPKSALCRGAMRVNVHDANRTPRSKGGAEPQGLGHQSLVIHVRSPQYSVVSWARSRA